MERVIRLTKGNEQPDVLRRVVATREFLRKGKRIIRLRTYIRILNAALQLARRNKNVGQEESDVNLIDEVGSKKGRISQQARIVWEEAFFSCATLRRAGFQVEVREKDDEYFLVTRISGGFRQVPIYQMGVTIWYLGTADTSLIRKALFKATAELPQKEKRKARKKLSK